MAYIAMSQTDNVYSLGGKVEKLHRAAKKYLDSVRAVVLLQERLAVTLESSFSPHDTAAFAQASSFKRVAGEIATNTKQQWDEAYRVTVLDPVARFGILFPECQELGKRRSAKLLDYDAARSKSRKAIEKPSGDSARLPRLEVEADEARKVYEEINHTLLDGIPRLVQIASPYLEPSLQAWLDLQATVAEKNHQFVASLATGNESNGLASETTLAELRSLDILHM